MSKNKRKIVYEQFTKWEQENYPDIAFNEDYLDIKTIDIGLLKENVFYCYKLKTPTPHNTIKVKYLKKAEVVKQVITGIKQLFPELVNPS